MTRAILKFNGGAGALLCNVCRKIVALGFDHDLTTQYFCFDCAGTISRARRDRIADSKKGDPP